jgi:hypothetical protein
VARSPAAAWKDPAWWSSLQASGQRWESGGVLGNSVRVLRWSHDHFPLVPWAKYQVGDGMARRGLDKKVEVVFCTTPDPA